MPFKTIISSYRNKRNKLWQSYLGLILHELNFKTDQNNNSVTQAEDGTQVVAHGGFFGS